MEHLSGIIRRIVQSCKRVDLCLTLSLGAITKAIYGADAKGNELTRTVSQSARSLVFNSAIPSSAPLRLDVARAAYLCLCTVVTRTQTKEPLFDGLLFKEVETRTTSWTLLHVVFDLRRSLRAITTCCCIVSHWH